MLNIRETSRAGFQDSHLGTRKIRKNERDGYRKAPGILVGGFS
jgi:hypothetical protein